MSTVLDRPLRFDGIPASGARPLPVAPAGDPAPAEGASAVPIQQPRPSRSPAHPAIGSANFVDREHGNRSPLCPRRDRAALDRPLHIRGTPKPESRRRRPTQANSRQAHGGPQPRRARSRTRKVTRPVGMIGHLASGRGAEGHPTFPGPAVHRGAEHRSIRLRMLREMDAAAVAMARPVTPPFRHTKAATTSPGARMSIVMCAPGSSPDDRRRAAQVHSCGGRFTGRRHASRKRRSAVNAESDEDRTRGLDGPRRRHALRWIADPANAGGHRLDVGADGPSADGTILSNRVSTNTAHVRPRP
jgi:hypothetical protein